QEPPEPTPYIVLLALRALSHTALDTLRDLPVSGPAGRALNGAVAAGLLTAGPPGARRSGGVRARARPRGEGRLAGRPSVGAARGGRLEDAVGQRAVGIRRVVPRAAAAHRPAGAEDPAGRHAGDGGPRRGGRPAAEGQHAQGGAAGGAAEAARRAAGRVAHGG